MCIRDSTFGYGIQFIGVGGIVVSKVVNGIIGAGCAGCIIPVSYTHLRAHETVLDLVCRLLLEKQKHTQTHTHNRDTKAPKPSNTDVIQTSQTPPTPQLHNTAHAI